LAFIEQIGSKDVAKPEASKETAIQESLPDAVDEKPSTNVESKPITT
jgi:hypothetical protein